MKNIFAILAGFVALLLTAGSARAADLTFWGAGEIGNPRCVTIAPNGEVWVGTSGRIAIFSAGGKFLRYDARVPNQINSIAFDKEGKLVIGTNDGFLAWQRGDTFDRVAEFGSYSPWEVAADDQGFVWATDGGHSTIRKFRRVGELILLDATIKAPATDPMGRPYSLAFDAKEHLLVSDEQKPGLWVFGRDGSFVKRILPTESCGRIARHGAEIFVAAAGGLAVLDADTLAVKRRVVTAGANGSRGLAVDAAGNLFFCDFYVGTVTECTSEGKLTRVLGPAYKAVLTVPDALNVGGETVLPLKVDKIATGDGPADGPQFKLALQPASLIGEPDSNYANHSGDQPDVNWWKKRQEQYEAGETALTATATAGGLRVQLPGTTATNLYQLIVRETGTADQQAQVVTAIAPGTTGGLTLLAGHNRSVFQQGEPLEIDAVLRDENVVRAGKLKISLTKRRGQELAFAPGQQAWSEFAVAGGATSQTLTFRGDTSAIYPGRYLIQAEYTAAGVKWHDVWPVEIVSAVAETRFKILFPEWSAGYTDIWGPFTGKGMAADAAALARTGVNFYDTDILHRGAGLPLQPTGPEADRVAALTRLAAAAPQVPASEKFAVASPLEIELQEALRNGLSMQRDIWGSHDMPDWGFANDMSIAVDNRRARIWTQWQREWPSWAGHRYLTLASGGDDYPETKALQAKLGIKPPTAAELDWARNGASWLSERGFISDAPIRSELTISAVATDAAGDIYVAASGTLLKYDAEGKLLHQTKLPGGEMIDMTVGPDGTAYIADPSSGRVIVVGPDDKVTTWPVHEMSNYSPRGIWMDRDGTLLATDMTKGRVHRYTTAGKLLQEFGAPEILKAAHGVTALKDGTIYVADAGGGGLSVFKADGTPVRFLPGLGGGAPGGKMDVFAAPDDTLWITGLSQVVHADRDGKVLARLGHSTFAPGGLSLAMSVAVTPGGHVLIADVATPYAQEWTQAGDPVRLLGTGSLFAEARLDRMRYTWTTPIIASLRRPIAALQGDAHSQLLAFARNATKDGSGEWRSVPVKLLSGTDYQITPPRLEGTVALRLVWAGAGAGADDPLHTDFSIQVSQAVSTADAAKMTDIVARQIGWKEAWAKARMGTLVRWTKESNEIARSQGRADTQNLAPTNYGTLDNLASGVWTPLRRDAVVAEANNEGHDYGSFPLHGAWYVARTLDGPDAKPIWASLLQWYWFDRADSTGRKGLSPRPLRDLAVLLGTGVSGMGPGQLPPAMGAPQRALFGKVVDHLHRLGEATTQLKPPGESGVAVLYSFTQEAMDPYNEEHFWTGHAVWYDLLRAHIPTAVVTEDSIERGALNRFRAVVIPNIQYPLPPKTLEALAAFREQGGEVWMDAGTRAAVPGAKLLRTRYRPFWIQDAYYWVHSGYGIGGYDGNSEYTTMKTGSNSRLPALLEAFGKYREAAVTTDDADVFLQTRRGGEATYVFASNDHFPNIPLYKTYLAAEAPVPATVRFALKGGAIYDALAMKRMNAGTAAVDFTDADPARVFAVLPRPIQSVALRASYLEKSIFGTVKVQDSGGKALAAVIPLQITVTDAAGLKRTLWRATDALGVCRFRVEAGWQAPAGAWRVEARELLSGKSAVPVRPIVTQPAAAPLVQDKEAALVFDAPAIQQQLARLKGKELWIALDKDQTSLRPLADGLAQSLGEAGIRAKVMNIPDIPQLNLVSDYGLTPDQQAAWNQVRSGGAVGLRQPSTTYREVGPDRVVMRPLILLGTAVQNSWLAEIEKWKLTRRTLSSQYPGQKRALVQYVWSPFYDGFDVIMVGAGDAEGLKAGIAALQKAAG